ncbi:MAG: PKD domain-containing protein [Parafilimonas sp.]
MRFIVLILSLITTPALAQLTADFSVSNTKGCSPLTVQFTDNSTGSPVSWYWDFGDGQSSTLQNPTITYTTSGSYSVRLIVKTATEQEYKQKDNYITVSATPDVKFDAPDGDSGCVDLQVSFQDQSALNGASVKSWLWDFGDGGTSSMQNPSHIYTTEGIYDVGLTIETTEGCIATLLVTSAIMAGNKPDPGFSASPFDGCASELRDFKNTSGRATAYYWDFGDGETSFDVNPKHHYTDTGTFTVKLLVSENGCIDSTERENYIHVQGAAANFTPIFNCDDRSTLSFRDISIAETGRLWNFGDGQTSTAKAVTHTYSKPGIYVVKLNVTGTTCNDSTSDTLHIKVTTPKVEILPAQNTYCRNDSLLFVVTDFDSVITKSFAWNSGDGYISNLNKNRDTLNFVYRKNGMYTPSVYIKDYSPCVDTIFYDHAITINGPMAEFKRDTAGCLNSQVNFQDASIPGDNAPIQQWFWNFGDGSTSTNSGPLAYQYPFSVVYNAQLTVTDINGCADTIIHTVSIADTPVVDAGKDTFACAENQFTLNPSGAARYIWAFNPDLSCTSCTNPIATPSNSVTYYVTGTNDKGCSSSDSVNVKVQTKELIAAQPDAYTVCNGGSVMFNISGADIYSWLPANTLNNATIQNPVAFPSTNTIYTVTGKDSNNCFSDVAMVSVTVNAKPTVDIVDSSVQILTGSTFNIIASASNDAQSFAWLPATGLSCYNCLQPVATVTKNTFYTLKATNQFGCIDSDHIRINAICTGESIFLPNTFSPNNDGMNDYFYPRSTSDINIQSLIIFNRWGLIVFQKRNFSSNNASVGWNGKYKNVLQNADVYIYLMELQCGNNNVFVKKGNISLIR